MRAQTRDWLAEGVFVGAGLAAMALFWYIVSRDRILWADELFGWMVVNEPSSTRMLEAWRAGADGGGAGFYLALREWRHVFGPSALAFRAFSSAGCGVGFAALWMALRRFVRPDILFVALFTAWFGSHTVLWQMVQTRFYGMLLGTVGLAVYAHVVSARHRRQSPGVLLMVFIANSLLVATHPLGIAYSGVLLLGAGAADWVARRRRPWFYASAVCGWWVILLSREAMVGSAAMGKPWFWTTRPAWRDLLSMYDTEAMPFPVLTVVAVVAVGLLLGAMLSARMRKAFRDHSDVLLPGMALCCFPVLVWVGSQGALSLFVDRYMIGFVAGVAMVLAVVLGVIFPVPWRQAGSAARVGWAVVATFFLVCVLHDAVGPYRLGLEFPPRDFTRELMSRLPAKEVAVVAPVDTFAMMRFYQRGALVHLQDWPYALDAASDRGEVSGFREMEKWKARGYFAESLQPVEAFLERGEPFVVVDGKSASWVKFRERVDPRWKFTQAGAIENGHWSVTLWQAERR